MENNYLKIFKEELKKEGLNDVYYDRVRWDDVNLGLWNRHFIVKRFLGIPLFERRIGEVVSIFPSDKDYHISCPLRIDVLDEKYTSNLERFARSYENRTNNDVELIINERRISTRFLQ